jgi:hypothetical protein
MDRALKDGTPPAKLDRLSFGIRMETVAAVLIPA